MAIAPGCQRGAIHSKHQVQPLVGPGRTKSEHLNYAVGLAENERDPLGLKPCSDPDLRFAAEDLVTHRHKIRERRKRQKRILFDLAKRCEGLDEELRKHQSDAVKRAAGKINVGLLTMIVILIGWADCSS